MNPGFPPSETADETMAADRPLFEAMLTPYRSLGRRGFNTVMLLVGLTSLASGIVFVSNGAWPIMGFFGLDVLLLWLAFRASYRSARAREEVRVSRTELAIRKISPAGQVREARYNPFWTRFHVDRHEEIGVTRMAVTGRGRTTEIGAFLNPVDRESFAEAFGQALAEAKRS
ncbi:putative membrane protein [Aureimonas jatrophae]|uniref:Uncharacterized membrane protein n=2 Tax=Aureimonas jatrophae TaxID=1166073 RepID=A0A1H0FMZ5_9HYPH|nr:putative membrane protein [Aureimonas jatrophae]SDN95990.1 Uncharacterized membrane protein [Aureimonas jatrophae]